MALAILLTISFPGATTIYAQSGPPEVTLVSPLPGYVATEGLVTLSWKIDPSDHPRPLLVELQQSAYPDFEDPVLRYRGEDHSSVLTGFPAGIVHFRVRAVSADGETGQWSEPLQVSFEYISMKLVWTLMGVGSFVLAGTCGAIIAGHTRTRREAGKVWKAEE